MADERTDDHDGYRFSRPVRLWGVGVVVALFGLLSLGGLLGGNWEIVTFGGIATGSAAWAFWGQLRTEPLRVPFWLALSTRVLVSVAIGAAVVLVTRSVLMLVVSASAVVSSNVLWVWRERQT